MDFLSIPKDIQIEIIATRLDLLSAENLRATCRYLRELVQQHLVEVTTADSYVVVPVEVVLRYPSLTTLNPTYYTIDAIDEHEIMKHPSLICADIRIDHYEFFSRQFNYFLREIDDKESFRFRFSLENSSNAATLIRAKGKVSWEVDGSVGDISNLDYFYEVDQIKVDRISFSDYNGNVNYFSSITMRSIHFSFSLEHLCGTEIANDLFNIRDGCTRITTDVASFRQAYMIENMLRSDEYNLSQLEEFIPLTVDFYLNVDLVKKSLPELVIANVVVRRGTTLSEQIKDQLSQNWIVVVHQENI